jgi:hypothetical protein
MPDGSLTALGRGQAVGVPPDSPDLTRDEPLRLVDRGGRLVAIARLVGTKLAPDKVLIDADGTAS